LAIIGNGSAPEKMARRVSSPGLFVDRDEPCRQPDAPCITWLTATDAMKLAPRELLTRMSFERHQRTPAEGQSRTSQMQQEKKTYPRSNTGGYLGFTRITRGR
jgi:hypothetical protein